MGTNRAEAGHVRAGDLNAAMGETKVWEYAPDAARHSAPTAERAAAVLRSPHGFPPFSAAVVEGDRVVLTVDPSVPELTEVIRGVLNFLEETDAASVAAVLWEETPERVLETLNEAFGKTMTITRHCSDDRESLRYLEADLEGNPVYANREVVDADVVLPVLAYRPQNAAADHDPTGLLPWLADSATRHRYLQAMLDPATKPLAPELGVQLGVQLTLSVKADSDGNAGYVSAGPPHVVLMLQADLKRTEPLPAVPLVVAVIDGGWPQQTWANATRALTAAAQFVEPGGTLVVWSGIADDPPSGLEQRIESDISHWLDAAVNSAHPFPRRDEAAEIAGELRRIMQEHRVLFHGYVDRETVESVSFGVLDDEDDLRRVCSQFSRCGLLRAAQFAGGSLHQPAGF